MLAIFSPWFSCYSEQIEAAQSNVVGGAPRRYPSRDTLAMLGLHLNLTVIFYWKGGDTSILQDHFEDWVVNYFSHTSKENTKPLTGSRIQSLKWHACKAFTGRSRKRKVWSSWSPPQLTLGWLHYGNLCPCSGVAVKTQICPHNINRLRPQATRPRDCPCSPGCRLLPAISTDRTPLQEVGLTPVLPLWGCILLLQPAPWTLL